MNNPNDRVAARERRLERNEKIREAYKKLSNTKTKKGAKKYTESYILERLSERFYLATATISNILAYEYEKALNRPRKPKITQDPNQLNLLDLIENETVQSLPK